MVLASAAMLGDSTNWSCGNSDGWQYGDTFGDIFGGILDVRDACVSCPSPSYRYPLATNVDSRIFTRVLDRPVVIQLVQPELG